MFGVSLINLQHYLIQNGNADLQLFARILSLRKRLRHWDSAHPGAPLCANQGEKGGNVCSRRRSWYVECFNCDTTQNSSLTFDHILCIKTATAMYVVATGNVQLHKEHRILAELGYGSCVGQAALLQYSSHAGAHITSCTALSDCILLSVSRDALDALMIETPSVSRGVLNSVASSIRWLYFEVRHCAKSMVTCFLLMSLPALMIHSHCKPSPKPAVSLVVIVHRP